MLKVQEHPEWFPFLSCFNSDYPKLLEETVHQWQEDSVAVQRETRAS